MTYMNKKANVIMDSAVFGLILFIFAILSVVGGMLFNTMNTDIQADSSLSSQAKNMSQDTYSRYYLTMDSAFAFVFVIFWIVLLVASFNINSHPIFFGVMVIVMAFILLAAAFFSNTYEEFTSTADLTASASNFTMTNFIMSHFFEVMAIVSFSVLITIYMKTSSLR